MTRNHPHHDDSDQALTPWFFTIAIFSLILVILKLILGAAAQPDWQPPVKRVKGWSCFWSGLDDYSRANDDWLDELYMDARWDLNRESGKRYCNSVAINEICHLIGALEDEFKRRERTVPCIEQIVEYSRRPDDF
jgi:hypothetical protein